MGAVEQPQEMQEDGRYDAALLALARKLKDVAASTGRMSSPRRRKP
jgi:hypothetical protein